MKPYRILLFAVAAVFMASCAKEPLDQNVTPKEDGSYENEEYVSKGWVRIRLADDAKPLNVGVFTRGAADSGDPDLNRLAADLGATEIRRTFTPNTRFEKRHHKYGLHLWFDVKFDESVPVSRASSQFAALPQIAIAEPIHKIVATDGPDYIMPAKDGFTVGSKANAVPAAEAPFNDPELAKQWHYNNDGSIPGSIAGADINLFKAWDLYGAGDPSVLVAIMDSGVEYDHPDLAQNMWVNTDEIPGNGKDDDKNGYIDDVYGYNFYKKSGTLDIGDHGTHVAGTVGAVNHNNLGVCGVAGGTGNGDGVKMMSVQIYSSEGSGDTDPDSWVYIADNGAIISQNSWSIPSMSGAPVLPEALSVAFDYFINEAGTDENGNQVGPMKGGVLIFAAGNQSSGTVAVPGKDPRILSVTAMLPDYRKTSYSNFGVDADIFAPGGLGQLDTHFPAEAGVYSTNKGGGYRYMSGTSMACPHVSGVAAIIVSKFGGPGFTNTQLKERLLRSTRNVSQYQADATVALGLGAGLIDAAMIDLQNPNVAPAKPMAVTVEAIEKVEMKLTVNILVPADANEMYVAGFNISYVKEVDKNDQSKWAKVKLDNNVDVGGIRSTEISKLKDATDYIFRVAAYDRFGNVSDEVEAKGRTVDHINRAPEHKAIINPINFPVFSGGSKSFETTLNLNDYFTDPDLPDDELTFSAESRDNTIAAVSVSGNVMTVKGLKKGNTSLIVYCADRDGLKINKGVAVKITQDIPGSGGLGIIKDFEPIGFPLIQNGVKVYETSFALNDYFSGPEGGIIYGVSSVSESIVSAELKNGNIMVLKGVADGNAIVNVEATSISGEKVSQSVNVTVTGKSTGNNNDVRKLSVYPNPVADFAKISVSGAGTADAQMKIYDSASRVVKHGGINLAGDTMQSYDMRGLAPGVYTMVVNVAGAEYKNTFVKK